MWALWEGRDWWFRARLFPWAIGFPGVALAVTQLCLDLRSVLKARKEHTLDRPRTESRLVAPGTSGIAGWILGFFLAIWLLGFPIAVPLMTFLYLKIRSRERWPVTIALTLLAWISFYGVFDYSLNVPFPDGLVFHWLRT